MTSNEGIKRSRRLFLITWDSMKSTNVPSMIRIQTSSFCCFASFEALDIQSYLLRFGVWMVGFGGPFESHESRNGHERGPGVPQPHYQTHLGPSHLGHLILQPYRWFSSAPIRSRLVWLHLVWKHPSVWYAVCRDRSSKFLPR